MTFKFLFTTLRVRDSDRDRSTVHVHFAIPHLVEPSPCHNCGACGKRFRDLEGKLVGYDSSGIVAIVADNVFHGATALDGMDNFPTAACCRSLVVGDRNLARSTAMHSTSLKFQTLS